MCTNRPLAGICPPGALDSPGGEMDQSLDEVSREIGRLTASVEALNSQAGALFRKLDENNRELIEHAGVIKHLGKSFDEHRQDVNASFAAVKAEALVTHHMAAGTKAEIEEVKNKGKGLKIGLTIAGGGGIAGFIAALQALFSGGSPAQHP